MENEVAQLRKRIEELERLLVVKPKKKKCQCTLFQVPHLLFMRNEEQMRTVLCAASVATDYITANAAATTTSGVEISNSASAAAVGRVECPEGDRRTRRLTTCRHVSRTVLHPRPHPECRPPAHRQGLPRHHR